MNQSLAVWEMSPIATAIDRDVMAGFKKLMGYPRAAEGSLVPGGAFANLTALLAARDALEPGASRTGKARIAIVVGAQAHYSIARAAAILGLGRDAAVEREAQRLAKPRRHRGDCPTRHRHWPGAQRR